MAEPPVMYLVNGSCRFSEGKVFSEFNTRALKLGWGTVWKSDLNPDTTCIGIDLAKSKFI